MQHPTSHGRDVGSVGHGLVKGLLQVKVALAARLAHVSQRTCIILVSGMTRIRDRR
jgi:hypothetical protein